MNVQFALLADAANSAANGKLNLLGVFDRISAGQFPTVHLSAVLVMRLAYSALEAGKKYDIGLVLVDPDGKELAAIRGKLVLPETAVGAEAYQDLIQPMNALPFPKPGDYRIGVVVNQEEKASVRLVVQKIEIEANDAD